MNYYYKKWVDEQTESRGLSLSDAFEGGRKAMIGWVYWAFVIGIALVIAIDIVARCVNKGG